MLTQLSDEAWETARLEIHTVGAGEVNEDAAGARGRTFWVIDASTPLFAHADARSEAYWFARRINELFTFGDEAPPRERLERVERVLGRELIARGIELSDIERRPSAAAGIVRVEGSSLEVAVLGDVYLVVETDGRYDVVTDSRVTRFDARAVAVLEERLRAGASYADAWPIVKEVLREHRLQMNRADTYWVLSGNADSAAHAVTRELPLGSSVRILLATDGLARAVEPFRLYSNWHTLLDTVRGSSVERVLAELREAETGDPECRLFPRLTPTDDATGLYVELHRTSAIP